MVQIMCEMLSKEKFVQISYITFFILELLLIISSSCAKKKGGKKGKKHRKLASSSRREDNSSSQCQSKPIKTKSSATVVSTKSSATQKSRNGAASPNNPSGVQSPSVAASEFGGGYQPPPYHERPRHPGFEAPIEDTEENKTEYQVNGFADAQNF